MKLHKPVWKGAYLPVAAKDETGVAGRISQMYHAAAQLSGALANSKEAGRGRDAAFFVTDPPPTH